MPAREVVQRIIASSRDVGAQARIRKPATASSGPRTHSRMRRRRRHPTPSTPATTRGRRRSPLPPRPRPGMRPWQR
jgi:hypothetical protein